jgi:hypothetical protein
VTAPYDRLCRVAEDACSEATYLETAFELISITRALLGEERAEGALRAVEASKPGTGPGLVVAAAVSCVDLWRQAGAIRMAGVTPRSVAATAAFAAGIAYAPDAVVRDIATDQRTQMFQAGRILGQIAAGLDPGRVTLMVAYRVGVVDSETLAEANAIARAVPNLDLAQYSALLISCLEILHLNSVSGSGGGETRHCTTRAPQDSQFWPVARFH